MTRWLRRFGLALSFAAVGLLAFHVDHADADHSNPAHRCCPCHSYSAAPNVSVAALPKARLVERLERAQETPSPKPALRAAGSPRAPPAA